MLHLMALVSCSQTINMAPWTLQGSLKDQRDGYVAGNMVHSGGRAMWAMQGAPHWSTAEPQQCDTFKTRHYL